MYVNKHIESFIEKTNKAAADAAQSIYDAAEPKLIEMIKNQMVNGDKICNGMGLTGLLRNGEFVYNIAEDFIETLNRTQWHKVEATFAIPDIIKD